MNTRKYPRTMNEAFPRTVEYASSIDRPARYALRTWPRIIAAVIFCLGLTMLVGMAFPTKS
jgi:hypothetical protein